MKYSYLLIIGLLISLASCGDSNSLPDVDGVESKHTIAHFDKAFFGMDSVNFAQELEDLKMKFPAFFNDEQSVEMLQARYNDSLYRDLYASVDSVFQSHEKLESELEQAFKYFYHYFPQDSVHVYTWCSNFESMDPITVSSNTMLIGLDMYLGKNSRFYKTAPQYLKAEFDQKYILPDLFYYYFAANIPIPHTNTLLASMVHYGKIHYLKSLLMPNYEQARLMKYSDKKMNWALKNEANIWAYFIENKLLYSTHQQDKRRFIDRAPFSKFHTDFDKDSPGRIAQWLGWKIVTSYMNANPSVGPKELINELDAQKILRESRYKPNN